MEFVIDQIRLIDSIIKQSINGLTMFDLEQAFTNILAHDFDNVFFRNLHRGLLRFSKFTRTNFLDRNKLDLKSTSRFLRRYIRLCAFTLVIELFPKLHDNTPSLQSRLKDALGLGNEKVQTTFEVCLDLWVKIVVLEERVQRNLSAIEGIWLVKEETPIID